MDKTFRMFLFVYCVLALVAWFLQGMERQLEAFREVSCN